MIARTGRGSTPRVQMLYSTYEKRSLADRSSEWFTDAMLPDVVKELERDNHHKYKNPAADTPIIERRARAFKGMLEAMTAEEFNHKTHSFEIRPGELIVGVIPMGSLGLGKVFPNYLTDLEREVAFFSARDVESVLGHNVPDFDRVLKYGLRGILDTCKSRRSSLENDRDYPLGPSTGINMKIAFYRSVEICCKAVVEYAKTFAQLARREAEQTKSTQRKRELLEIARICRKVPLKPAGSFYEALHSIYLTHLALHSTASHLSLGRLDQLLQPFYEESLGRGEITRGRALELFECFFIKCAERTNLTLKYAEKQDHTDSATGMGNMPFFIDQEATINQFMQNLVIGGQTRSGEDATNDCTYLILDACANLGLATPTINARIHKGSPKDLVEKVASCQMHGNCGMPIIFNDDAVVPAFVSGGFPIEEARDYCVDGCWETILNAKSDFTYNMVNMLPVMECALNGGALLTDSKKQLRGPKASYLTPLASELKSFQALKDTLVKHLRLMCSKAGMQIYANYCLEGSVTPVPFFSALLGKCLEKGIDKTWGGADYIVGGIVFIAMPNCANALAAINEWVYQKRKYGLEDVVEALRNNFECQDETIVDHEKRNAYFQRMLADFKSSPKFGNGDKSVDKIMTWLVDEVHDATKEAEKLAATVFLDIPRGARQSRRISELRGMAGYYGESMKERFGRDFDINFTVGCGTFAQYAHFGEGCAASADGRRRGQPVAPNFSPVTGTAEHGVGGVLESLKPLSLDRFNAGVMTDICLEEDEVDEKMLVEVLRKFRKVGGSILSITVARHERLAEAKALCDKVREGTAEPEALEPYCGLTVRVGGWNGPFVTLTEVQQKDYLDRALKR